MTWRDRLKSAEWRGVEFLTESHDAKEGRRLSVHELPGGDVPVVEDLGAKARTWRVAAYFIGPDYDQARDRFLAALRTPGADWLTHPWLGRVWARAQDWSTSETNAEGGMAKVSVEFAEGGGGVPQPQPDLVDVAEKAVAAYVQTAAEMAPQPMGMGAVVAYVARVRAAVERARSLMAMARMPLETARAIRREIDGALALFEEARDLRTEYARLLLTIADVLGRHGGELLRNPQVRGTGDAARARVVAALCKSAPVPGSSRALDGEAALSGVDRVALWRNAAAEQSARAHWTAAVVMQMALADYDTAAGRDQAMALVQAAVANAVAVSDDPVARQADPLAVARFEAAMSARAAVLQALAAQPLAPTQTREVARAIPAVVLAYRMGVAEDVLVARNGVRHPLFVRGVVRV